MVQALTRDRVAISEFLRDEIVRVLTGKFGRDRGDLETELGELLAGARWVEVIGEVCGACRDPKDDAILETAWKARAELLVAGDKDLLSLGAFRNTKILSPAAYMKSANTER